MIRCTLNIPFESEEEAKVVSLSLSKEEENERYKIKLHVQSKNIVIEISAADIVILRAIVNSYCKQLYPLLNLSEVVK